MTKVDDPTKNYRIRRHKEGAVGAERRCRVRDARGRRGAGEPRAAGGAAPAPAVPTTPRYRLPLAPRTSVNRPAITLAKTSPSVATELNQIAAIVYSGFDIQRGAESEI